MNNAETNNQRTYIKSIQNDLLNSNLTNADGEDLTINEVKNYFKFYEISCLIKDNFNNKISAKTTSKEIQNELGI